MKKSRKYEIANVSATAITCILQAMTKHAEDDIDIYRYLVDSELIPRKFLSGKIKPFLLLKELIKAYNGATSPAERKLLLSWCAGKYTYEYLCQFNRNRNEDVEMTDLIEQSGIVPESDLENSDSESDLDENDNSNSDTETVVQPEDQEEDEIIDVFFDRNLTKEIYYESRKLYFENGEKGLSAPIIVPTFRQRLSPAMLECLFDFWESSVFLQSMAYGTISRKAPSGAKMVMAKVVRHYSARTMVNMGKAYLSEQGFTPPCESTLFDLLQALPAGQQKQIRGVNPYQVRSKKNFCPKYVFNKNIFRMML